MINTNCLENIKCPTCGNEEWFRIAAKTIATVTDDGDIAALSAEGERRGLSVHFLILDHLRVAPDLRAIARLIDGGRMRMPAITRYPLERAGEALQAMQAGGIRGKLVIEIADLG